MASKGNYGTTTETVPVSAGIDEKGATIELVTPQAKYKRVKGIMDEVELSHLLMACTVCFFITFGIKATQTTKANAVKTLIVITGSFVLFGLLVATVLKVILLQKEKNKDSNPAQGPCTLC